MYQPVVMPSNSFWGKRSGKIHKDGSLAFEQKKYGNGSMSSGKPDRCKLINVPHKWFKVTYKSKRG